jgi:hypothetical protein
MESVPEMTPQSIADELGEFIRDQLKQLLETQHLYQNFHPNIKGLVGGEQLEGHEWQPNAPLHLSRRFTPAMGLVPDSDAFPMVIRFDLPGVQLYCKKCGLQAFNPIYGEDFLEHRDWSSTLKKIGSEIVQVFVLSFQCQLCKQSPEVFIVTRKRLKLAVSGRSEIEHVEVPKFIPEEVKGFYSRAVIAHQSKQTLAGILFLRTVIEQWARKQTGEPTMDAAILFEKYMATLPKNFNDQFPSMRDLYKNLSEDIHLAIGSPQLFERARADIDKHFEARLLFKDRLQGKK